MTMKKALFGIFAAAAFLGSVATVAEAKTNFSLYFGVPYFDDQIGPDYRYYQDRGWYQDPDWYDDQPNYYQNTRRKMSCNQARSIVRNQGYRSVVARECGGRTYTFSARRNNQRVIIYVNARTGRVSRG
jgi:hypothetical protein